MAAITKDEVQQMTTALKRVVDEEMTEKMEKMVETIKQLIAQGQQGKLEQQAGESTGKRAREEAEDEGGE